ncbi:uncharacterized protein BDW47DRAFT_118537 [Aspergillus candidus]|uniref:Glutathione hydrolase n=1 Tax=Aspergillus candidus TaxID=41067 RepID=A0A2I2F7K9_ASPCN|nr:nucleophile aminohydrolase [Aspergillus candidus]PLB36606.1 nucleophile aminohydrolase [Aspergillus candidus]
MPSRRSHTKSRRGCLHCKRRHVKCDEGSPKCGLCRKRKLECIYPPPGSSDGDTRPPSTPREGGEEAAAPAEELSLPTRMLEMRLFHHYLTDTYTTLLQANLGPDHFQMVVPRLAMGAPFLLDSLLALAALHLATREPDDKGTWLEAALKYQNRACSAFSRVLAELTPEESGPAFICSIFIMLCATAYPCISQDSHLHAFDPLTQVLEVRRLMAGCALLFGQLNDVEHVGELRGWLVYKNEGAGGPGHIPIPMDPNLVRLKEALHKSLEKLQLAIDKLDESQRAGYRRACALLQEATARWPMGYPNGGFIAWPVNIDEAFLSCLKDGHWMARVVFLHYGALGSVGPGQRGAVASESELCSRHGTEMLLMGGNAADASGGIGGGGFQLIKTPDNQFEFIDFRESAPAAASENMFKNKSDASTKGGLASGVPGELRGLEYLHNKYGSLPWSTVMQPAIQTARQGFPVTEDLVRYMKSAVGDDEDFLSKNPTWALDFAPNGTRLGLGDTITRRRYADTLETIAKHGAEAFYSGPIAEATIAALTASNGTMTMEDLRNYTVAVRDVAQINYRGYKVSSATAPSSGIVVLNVLKVLNMYDEFFTPGNVNLSTHRMDEAIRFGYGQRTNLGDPYFLDGLDEYQKKMLSDATIKEIHGKISDTRTQNASAYDPDGLESLNTPGTSHIAAVDHTGLAISEITTINLLFGSKLMVPETGIIMNNEMDDFSTPGSSNSFGYIPSPANFIRPGKRPLSSMTPAMVTHPNGTVFFIAGSAGGSRIITATLQNIIHAVDEGMSAAEALAQPRLHDQLIPSEVQFEYSYDNSTVAFMKSLGHNVTWLAPGESSAQAIRRLPNGTFDAAGEPRQLNSGGIAV